MNNITNETFFSKSTNSSLMSASGVEAIGIKTYPEIGDGGKYMLNSRTDRTYCCVDEEKQADGPNRKIEMKFEVEGQVQMLGDLTVNTETGEIISRSLVVAPGAEVVFGFGSQFLNGVKIDKDAKTSDLFTFTGLATFADPTCDCRTAVEIMGKTMAYLWAVAYDQDPHQYVATATAIQMLDRFGLRDNIDIPEGGDDKVQYIANLFRLGFSEVEFTLKNKLQAQLQLLGNRGNGKEAGAALSVQVPKVNPERSKLFPAKGITIISAAEPSTNSRFIYSVTFEEEREGETYINTWQTADNGERSISAFACPPDSIVPDEFLSAKLEVFYRNLGLDPYECYDLDAEMCKLIEVINAQRLMMVSPVAR